MLLISNEKLEIASWMLLISNEKLEITSWKSGFLIKFAEFYGIFVKFTQFFCIFLKFFKVIKPSKIEEKKSKIE